MRFLLTTSTLALMAASSFAATEVVPAGDKMANDYAPLGVRAKSFLVIPKVDVDFRHDSNIFATQNNEKSSLITIVKPEVAVKSNWNRHAVNALVRAERKNYHSASTENVTNYLAAIDGRVDVLRETSIGAGVGFSRTHEDRGDPNTPASAAKPSEVDTTTFKVGAYRGLGKLNARIDSEARNLNFKNAFTTAGALIDNNARDRMEYAQTLRLGYQFDPRFEAFIRGTADARVYDRKGGAAPLRSNHGKEITVGSTFDLSGKTKGEVYLGNQKRNYVDSTQKDISTVTYGAKATWNPSALTSVIVGVDRGIEETTLANSSGYIGTNYTAKVEHSFTRKILAYANLGYGNSEYEGTTGTQRKDKVTTAGTGVAYFFNRNFRSSLGYEYTNRDSNITGGDFDRNVILLRLTATY